MRNFLDAILEFISAATLTDLEFATITLPLPPAYTNATYLALRTVLESRESVSDQVTRLKLYFVAKGVDVSSAIIPTPNSNIFIGAVL